MSEQTSQNPLDSAVASTAEPSRSADELLDAPPKRGFVAAYALATFGVWLALLTPVVITLAVKITSIVSRDGVTGALSLVTGVGALLALVANPLFGRLSDRTRSPWGRRRPWIAGGMVGGLVGLVVIASASAVPMVLVGWCIAQLSFNAALAALIAVLPDRVPDAYRGRVSGILGGMLPLATVVGAALAQAVAPNLALMIVVPGVVGLLATVWLLVQREPGTADLGAVEPFTLREFLSSFVFNPKANPDFGWAWLSRFLVFIGLAFILTYQAVILSQHLGASDADLPKYILLSTVANAAVILVSSTLGGRLSDRVGRRKPFVCAAAVLYAASMVLFINAKDPRDFVVAMAAAGVGYGLYLSTDLALVTAVLPDAKDAAAKDMGVFNIANALPQSISPAIAPLILAIGASAGEKNWTALFVAAAVAILAGALAILPVRSVR
jgi:MFS family permease